MAVKIHAIEDGRLEERPVSLWPAVLCEGLLSYSAVLHLRHSFLDNHTFQDEIITKKVRSLDVGIDAFIYLPWIKACAK